MSKDIVESLQKTQQRVAHILKNYPAARNSDNLLIKLYWEIFDGVKSLNDIVNATSPESIRRARQKLNEKGEYLPTDPNVIKRRRLYSLVIRDNIKAV